MNRANNLNYFSRITLEYRPNMSQAQQTIRNRQVRCLCLLNRSYYSPDGPVYAIQALSCTTGLCSCRGLRGQRETTYFQPIQLVRMVAIFVALATAAAIYVRRTNLHLYQT